MDIIQDNYTYAMRVVNLFKIETIFRVQWQKKLKKIIAHNGLRLGGRFNAAKPLLYEVPTYLALNFNQRTDIKN